MRDTPGCLLGGERPKTWDESAALRVVINANGEGIRLEAIRCAPCRGWHLRRWVDPGQIYHLPPID